MAQQLITNGESGFLARTAINDNFTELYNVAVIPIQIAGVTGNSQQSFNANTFLLSCALISESGSPIVNIGTTPNGGEIVDTSPITNAYFVQTLLYMESATTLYITVTGTGSIKLRFDYQKNYFI